MKYIPWLIAALAIAACNRPIAKFQIEGKEDRTFIAPASVPFQNQSEQADSFHWSFGDGHHSFDDNPRHTYYQSGNYEVTLKAIKNGNVRTMKERVSITPPEKCLVLIRTPKGNMVAHLYDKTPKHRDNFLKLTKEGFYDSLLFHRVIEGFMIQGGDPDSRDAAPGQPLGMGGPGYTVEEEIDPKLIHKKGALAAARKGDQANPEKASSGSQFYIVDGNSVSATQLKQISTRNGIDYNSEQEDVYLEKGGIPFLDGQYTVFGEVIDGLEVIDSIATVRTDSRDRPREDMPMVIEPIR